MKSVFVTVFAVGSVANFFQHSVVHDSRSRSDTSENTSQNTFVKSFFVKSVWHDRLKH